MIYVIVIILGLVIGSFINVCICRIPQGESICFPPSHCSSCLHRLKVRDLVPVMSYIFLGGRCRYCNEKISIQYPMIELLNSGAYLLVYLRYGVDIRSIVFMVLASCLIMVSAIDIKVMEIPNGICLFIAITGFFFSLFIFPRGLMDGLLGGLAGGGTLLLLGGLSYVLFKKEGMGGGDIKLAAAVGLFLGWKQILIAFVLAVYIALAVILVIVILKKFKRGQYIAFGPFLSISFFMVGLYFDQIILWYIGAFL